MDRSTTTRARRVAVAAALCTVPGMVAAGSLAAAASVPHRGAVHHASAKSPAAGVKAAEANIARYTRALARYPSPGPALNAKAVAKLKGKTVLFVPYSTSIQYFTEMASAMQTAFSHVGIKVTTCDAHFVPSAAASCVLSAKAAGASAVVTGAISYNLISTAYQQLKSEGVPVLLADAPAADGIKNSDKFAFQDSDHTLGQVGTLAADEIIAKSDGKAHVLFIEIMDTASIVHEGQSMLSEFSKNCPDCKVTTLQFNTANLAQLASAVSSKLIADPSIDYILPQTDADVAEALSGAQSANASSRVQGVSTDGTLGALQDISSHQFLFADVGYSAAYDGWTSADGVLRMLTGAPVPLFPYDPIRVFDASNVKGLQLTTAASNSNIWYGTNAFYHLFWKLWTGKP